MNTDMIKELMDKAKVNQPKTLAKGYYKSTIVGIVFSEGTKYKSTDLEPKFNLIVQLENGMHMELFEWPKSVERIPYSVITAIYGDDVQLDNDWTLAEVIGKGVEINVNLVARKNDPDKKDAKVISFEPCRPIDVDTSATIHESLCDFWDGTKMVVSECVVFMDGIKMRSDEETRPESESVGDDYWDEEDSDQADIDSVLG